jgi:hypothetical protein
VIWGSYVGETAFDLIRLCINNYNIQVDQNGGPLQNKETKLQPIFMVTTMHQRYQSLYYPTNAHNVKLRAIKTY